MSENSLHSFLDLKVYQSSYQASITIHKHVLSLLPLNEKFDLKDQMQRASKSIPALIAEGYAKKQHQKHWQKYLRDAIGEANEMIVHLSFTKDLYGEKVGLKVCSELIETYNIIGKQLYRLAESWEKRP